MESPSRDGGSPSRLGEGVRVRRHHASATVEVPVPPEVFFAAFAGWFRYDEWAPDWQSAAHWLVVHDGGLGSRFMCYDKPKGRHLVHVGEVTAVDPGRRFAWRAPFCEWARADVGSELELSPIAGGGTRATETFFFDASEEHLPVIDGFAALEGLDPRSMEDFLRARLEGLGALLRAGGPSPPDEPFAGHRVVARDWVGRRPEGEWVRVLYADGEIDFDGPPDLVFNAFSRFASYADWTRMIHVGNEWFDVVPGGVGSRFAIWEKPGDRHVIHQGAVTELERGRKFAWRAPFAEWDKVLLGTAMTITGSSARHTRAYHVLYVDLPREYLPIFAGFGSLHGFDIEFETFHIHEEARGFNRLLRDGAFTGEHAEFLFDRERRLARDIPLQHGREWATQALEVVPVEVLTYEELLVELSRTLADTAPTPRFLRMFRNLERTLRLNRAREG